MKRLFKGEASYGINSAIREVNLYFLENSYYCFSKKIFAKFRIHRNHSVNQ
ncbi:MAG: hypothetical protein LBJ00_06210 [Planctomycetaceae bacterium]|nr:hypothetical protein [Planctomycetaceae bacterium]